jgi:hypothetical protein
VLKCGLISGRTGLPKCSDQRPEIIVAIVKPDIGLSGISVVMNDMLKENTESV